MPDWVRGAEAQKLRWDILSSSGWQYLLPPLSTAHVLCVDVNGSVAPLLANLCREVTVLCPARSATGMQARVAALGLDNVHIRQVSGGKVEEWLEGVGKEYDGFVMHDPGGRVLNQGSTADVVAAVGKVRTVLRRGGFAYFGIRNGMGYDRLLRVLSPHKWKREGGMLKTGRGIKKMLERAGYFSVRCHPYIYWQEFLAEVIPEDGYASTRNSSHWREKLKVRLLGRCGSQILAPGYGVVGFAEVATTSVVELVLAHVQNSALCRLSPGEQVRFKQYFVLNGGKVILAVGPEGEANRDVVVVLVRDRDAQERRAREAGVLRRLAKLPEGLSRLTPRLLGEFELGEGTKAYVLNRFPGATADLDVAGLDQVSDRALDVLIELHRETRRLVHVGTAEFDELFGDLFKSARARNSVHEKALNALEQLVGKIVRDLELPTVWFHGDFKIENIMYDPLRLEITGVIDWEYSRKPGLPWLDLVYLHLYNRVIRGKDWLEAYAALVLRNEAVPVERARVERYLAALDLPAELVAVLGVMFLVHHIGCRMDLDKSNSETQERVAQLLEESRKMLERRYGDGIGCSKTGVNGR